MRDAVLQRLPEQRVSMEHKQPPAAQSLETTRGRELSLLRVPLYSIDPSFRILFVDERRQAHVLRAQPSSVHPKHEAALRHGRSTSLRTVGPRAAGRILRYGEQQQNRSGATQGGSEAKPRQGRAGACQEGGEAAQERAGKQGGERQGNVEDPLGLLMSTRM